MLYFGDGSPSSNARRRQDALIRLGYDVHGFNPAEAVSASLRNPLLSRLHFRSGYRLLQPRVEAWLRSLLKTEPPPDLVWVNGGELFGPRCLETLRSLGVPVILYNNDDPTGRRDGRRFDMLLRSIPLYDLCATVREVARKEYLALGARKVSRVWMSYDEIAHAPFDDPQDIPEKFRSEVAFIGTWMRGETREDLLLGLVSRGVDVSIWGNGWQRSPQWSALSSVWRGPAIYGRDYAAAVQGAKICIGLLSKGNRDLHTRRSIEIPYSGGLLCAERTSEHMELYAEGKEAVLWDNVDECAGACKSLLAAPERLEAVRAAGMRRVRDLKLGNEDICRTILAEALRPASVSAEGLCR